MNITDQFPIGQWNDANSHFVVRVGCYWEAVAVRDGTEIVLTPLGQSMVAPVTAPVEMIVKEEVSTLDTDETAPGIAPLPEAPRKGKRQ